MISLIVCAVSDDSGDTSSIERILLIIAGIFSAAGFIGTIIRFLEKGLFEFSAHVGSTILALVCSAR